MAENNLSSLALPDTNNCSLSAQLTHLSEGVGRTKLLEQANLELQQELERQERRIAEMERVNQELVLARDRAVAAGRTKSTFLANMSHELRTPLNAILGYAQLVARDESLARDHRESLETILHSGEHLLSLINNVLNLSKIEAGQMKLQPGAFNLLELLSGLGQMFNIQARAKGLDFVVQRRSALPELIYTDQQKLRQVLINLLGNAVQYTAVGQITLTVWTTHRSGQQTILYLVVEDTGVGIAPADLERLFLPFEQSGYLLQEAEGTGLGLAICKQFVQLLNGHLHVESQVGQGSRFTVEIPVSVVSTPPPSLVPERRIIGVRPNPDASAIRVLVVDDQPANRQMLELLLGRCRLDVVSVSNGRDALEMTELWRPHLIFMDMRMPIMGGMETTRRLRAMPQGQSVPIVALTASVFEEERKCILAGGCDAFISKPFREEDIFKLLAHYLPVSLSYASVPKLAQSVMAPLPTADALPTAVREELYTAVCSAQGNQILQLIIPLETAQPQLFQQLSYLVHEFRYDIILDWLKQ